MKKYFEKNYNGIKEYKVLKNPDTNQWLKCDIYILYGENPKTNGVYIEVHGEQHYKINGWHKLKAEKNKSTPEEELKYQKWKDKIKKNFCKKNGTYIEVNLMKIKTVEEAIEYIENKLSQIGE